MTESLAYVHLHRLTTPLGLFEHAAGAHPRIEHGYCVDDVARALVVTCRDPAPSAAVLALADGYLDFVLAALGPHGLMHNRRDADGVWVDAPGSGDHWGRGLWALGVAAASGREAAFVSRARAGAGRAMRARSQWPRAMSYAALGAVEILTVHVEDPEAALAVEARALLEDTRALLGRPRPAAPWRWPEQRLTYANAVLPEALLAIGQALRDEAAAEEGLALLTWLVEAQQHHGHLSVVPAGGWSPADLRPGFAQQPIEVTTLAEACRRAYGITGDLRWMGVVDECRAWFAGANDVGAPVMNEVTGAGFDGLERDRVSINQGAESTLAWLATHQLSLMTRASAS